jgi:sec-independent protein translocase protein TatC
MEMKGMKKENTMPFLDHLAELRTRLIKCFIALVIGMGVTWHFAPVLLSFVEQPLTGHTYLSEMRTKAYEEVKAHFPRIYQRYQPQNDVNETSGQERKLNYSAPLEPFFVQIKISLIAGIVLAFPVIICQLWLFVAPGLMPNERRMTIPVVAAGTVSFCLGALFCLTVIWPVVISFSLSYEAEGLRSWFNLSAYVDFCLRLILIFGLVFELPVVAGALARLGLITPQLLAGRRKYAILGSAIVAAFHADIMTMSVVWIPLYLMYEVSIWVVRVLGRKRPAFEQKVGVTA